MFKTITTILFLILSFSAISQESVTVTVTGVTLEVAKKLQSQGDRISWMTMRNSDKLASNIEVEITNIGEKLPDRGKLALQIDPNINGMYQFSAPVEVKLKKVDLSKPIFLSVTIETIQGNEIFFRKPIDIATLSSPIQLDGYMWRASNEKIAPERNLCISFSTFISDSKLKAEISNNEGSLKFDRLDYTVFLKQEGREEWWQLKDKLEGSFSNGNSMSLTNPLPAWIDPSKQLAVRFAAKTPLSNFIWDEYTVEPHEYRKEYRATNYTSKAFDKNAKPNLANANTVEIPVKEEASPVVDSAPEKAKQPEVHSKDVIESKPVVKASPISKGGIKLQINYDKIIVLADSLFSANQFSEAKTKYEEASKLMPNEEYPKVQTVVCDTKLKAINNKKLKINQGMK